MWFTRFVSHAALAALLAASVAVPGLCQEPASSPDPAVIRAKLAEIDAELDKLRQLRGELEKMLGPTSPQAPKPPVKKPWTDSIKLDGYIQVRAKDTSQDRGDFDLRRVRCNVRGALGSQTRFRIELGGDRSSAHIRDAWIERKVSDKLAVRAGQVTLPFGYELYQGSSDRLPLERTRAASLPFADRRDNGLLFTRTGSGVVPEVNLWVVNGQGRTASDANHGKNVGGRLNWQTAWGQWGISAQNGSFVNSAGVSTDRDAIGLHVVYDKSPLALQAEYVTGKALGADLRGWYGQATYTLPGGADRVFVRHEQYDPNTDRSGDGFHGTVLGACRDLDANNRLTVQWADGREGDASRDEWGAQWQIRF